MPALQEILPNIITWSEFSEDKQLNFNGYLVAARKQSVLIDPPGLEGAALDELRAHIEKDSEHPLKAILLTNVHHVRNSRNFREMFSTPILINEKDDLLLDFNAEGNFRDGDILFCGIQVVHLENQKSPGESAFYLEDQNAMIVGDALIRKEKLGQLPADKFKDIVLAKKGLEKLKDYEYDALLLGDGEPILKGGKKAVVEFLEE